MEGTINRVKCIAASSRIISATWFSFTHSLLLFKASPGGFRKFYDPKGSPQQTLQNYKILFYLNHPQNENHHKRGRKNSEILTSHCNQS